MFKRAWGYRSDGDAGLSQVGARYYDAQVGRFITRDTYLDEHPYLYCEHDPINLADSTGHWPEWIERMRSGIQKVIDWGIERLEQAPSGTLGVYIRGLGIFAPIWVPAVGAAIKYRDRFPKFLPSGSIGRANGGTRKSQREMIERESDPDYRGGNDASR